MTPYFSTTQRIAALLAEAETWRDTPFVDGIGARARKGTACDCVSWIAATLQAVGAIGAVPWPARYVSANGGPEMLEILLQTLGGTERLRKIFERSQPLASLRSTGIDLLPGDLLCGTSGRARHHLAIYIGDNRIMHCWRGAVTEGNAHDSALLRYLHSIWRAYAI